MLMPYRFTCSICGREFRGDERKETVARAQDHFERQHERELTREEAIENIVQE